MILMVERTKNNSLFGFCKKKKLFIWFKGNVQISFYFYTIIDIILVSYMFYVSNKSPEYFG